MNNEIENYLGELATLREKVQVYENMLHNINMYSSVTLDNPPITHMIDIINGWSYSHRAGNGELSDEEVHNQINFWFEKMKNSVWRDSVRNSGIETAYKVHIS